MEINGTKRILRKGDIQRILPLTEHRFTGLEKSVILEVSTHHDEKDSYRKTQSEKIPEEEFKKLLKKIGI
jgi:quercetin dioxygenase-like cupin family protein